MLVIVGTLNLVLAGVSLVPAFPLDGGRVVRAIGWARTGDPRRGARLAAMVGRWVGWAACRGRARGDPAGDNGAGIPDGIMLGLIGWFLGASARSVDRWVVIDGLIAGVRVEEAMEAEMETISPQLTLDTFGQQVLDGTLGPALPVLRAGELVGIVGALQLRTVPRRDWPIDPDVGGDGRRGRRCRRSGRRSRLTDGLERLRTSQLDGLPVLDGDGPAGRVDAAVDRGRAPGPGRPGRGDL